MRNNKHSLVSLRTVSLLVLVLLLGFYFFDMVASYKQEIELQIFIANDNQNIFPARVLEKEITSAFGLTKDKRIVVDDSLYVIFDAHDQIIEASLSKIYAYIAAKELDIFIAPEEVARHYSEGLPMLNLQQLFAKEPLILSHLKNPYILDISSTRYRGSDASFLVVPVTARHQENIVAFIRYAFDLP